MKINPFQPVQQNPYRKNMEKAEQTGSVQAKRDQLEISSKALEMQKGTPIEKARQEKVAELKKQIEAGDYKVNPQAIANKFYEYWNE